MDFLGEEVEGKLKGMFYMHLKKEGSWAEGRIAQEPINCSSNK